VSVDEVELGSYALSGERARDYDEWVARRLAGWSVLEIQALERWLLHESHFEFIPAVRTAWSQRAASSGETAA
jgi:hypothetical protein